MAAANVIRELFVALGVKYDAKSKKEIAEFDKAVDRIKVQMQDLGDYALRAGKFVAASVVAAAGAAGLLAVQAGQNAENIERQARALNLTRQEYQEFEHVFATFGSDSKEISEAFLQISQQASNAVHGQKAMVQSFALIGISVDQLKGKRPNELFELVADAMKNTKNRQDALAAASALFGEDTAKKLLPALVQGADAIRKMRLEAHDLGLVMGDEQLKKLKGVSTSWRSLKNTARGLMMQIGVALAPTIERLLLGLQGWLKANRELIALKVETAIRRIESAINAADKAAKLVGGWDVVFMNVATGIGILTLLANLDKVLDFLGAAKLAITALQVVAGPALGALGLSLAPVLLVLAGFVFFLGVAALAVDDFLTYMRGGESVLGDNIKWLGENIPVLESFRQLLAAVGMVVLQGFVNVGKLASAIGTRLTPVFEFLRDDVLQPLIDQFAELWEWFRTSGGWMRSAAGWLNGVTGDAAAGVDQVAAQIAGPASSSVDGQIFGATAGRSYASSDSSIRTANVTQNIYGADGGAVGDAVGREFRKAGLAPAGGER